MTNFFRQIRKKMADDNRPLKYLRYAIGEIVLVVIGILIALQINTWNEERKDSIKKHIFKKALIEDLKKDTSEVTRQISALEERIKVSNELILKMEKSDATLDTIIRLYLTRTTYVPIPFSPNKSTFESLYSTGNIELFSNEEISILIDFYEDVEVDYSLIRQRMQKQHQADINLGDKYGYLWKKNKNNHLYRNIIKNFNEQEFLTLMDLAVYKDNQTTNRNKRIAEEILIETDSLIKILSHQIE